MVKNRPKIAKSGISVFLCFSERCHGNMCNLNVTVVLEFLSRGLYLLFAVLLSSKFQNSIFYQHMHMRLKSGLKFPRPFCFGRLEILIKFIKQTKTL